MLGSRRVHGRQGHGDMPAFSWILVSNKRRILDIETCTRQQPGILFVMVCLGLLCVAKCRIVDF